LKNIDPKNLKDPNKIVQHIKNLEDQVQQPLFDHQRGQEVKINLRRDENIAPAMFKPDPLIPGGYVANSLTLRAMRSDLFIYGEGTEDLESIYLCACGKELDVQFWQFCPFCSREFKF
jgi:hypothetical protein